ncbi:MAG: prepilin-type N-terminal cleavage/methylation domain-containing protein [Lachnospiraceae bacterium]|nr:prepilin-type N-terminal cleavage/methylation domain-containing protein [Lachnospiraceae bacterium]
MGGIMRILQRWRERKRDNRGLSLVELMCAIAILGLIGATVSGVMIVSAQSYQRGAGDIELQQEAQIAVNQIGDLVIDTTAQVTATADGSSITIDKDTSRYVITHNSATHELLYSEYIVNGDGSLIVVVENQLMAENVEVFKADAADFSDYGILRLRMELVKGDRSYAADFTITARNGQLSVSEVTAAATIVTETELVLEPNQEYELNATVMGTADGRVVWELTNNTDVNTYVLEHPDGTIRLHVGNNETADTMMLMVRTVTTNGVSPLASLAIPVRVRRVNDVSVSGTLTSGVPYKTGATYRVTANVAGTNLARLLGLACDTDYVNPYRLTWSYTLKDIEGNEVSDIENYIEWAEDSTLYNTMITLKQDLGDMELTVTAVAQHPDGTNKTSIAYGHEEDSWTLSGFIRVVMEGDWRRGGNSRMLLQNVDESNLITLEDGTTWLANYGVVNMKWYRYNSLGWEFLTEQGNQGTWGSDQDTNAGIISNFATGSPLILFEYLQHDRYSYSCPYYMNSGTTYDYGISKLKVEIDFGGYQTGSGVFNIQDIAIEYRNSRPDDPEDSWSPETGAHVVYVTPEDSTDLYTSYFHLLHGWDDDFANNQGYYLYNRFVGVIKDEPGYENDECYDLTFVNGAGVPYKRSAGEAVDWAGNTYLQVNENFTWLSLLNDQISTGSDGNYTISAKITQDEKNRFCADGTVIKEIYEYNYSFGSNWWTWMSDESKARFEAVDGCDGILEFHFVPANVQITNHAGNAPAVRYCPRAGEAGLNAGGYYYINATSRYKVNGSQAEYQVNNGGSWATQYMLTWNGSKWCD